MTGVLRRLERLVSWRVGSAALTRKPFVTGPSGRPRASVRKHYSSFSAPTADEIIAESKGKLGTALGTTKYRDFVREHLDEWLSGEPRIPGL